MNQDEKPPVKYRIKSYYYDEEAEDKQLLFTIEELGYRGELRKYAHEIVAHPDWQALFSQDDVAKISFAINPEREVDQ